MTTPADIHLGVVNRILRYLQGTIQHGLVYYANTESNLNAFSNLDWATNLNTRRSMTGNKVFLANNPISWQSKE